MRTIEINGVAYPFKYGYGALMMAEELLGQPWGTVQNMRSNLVLFFACLFNADADCPITFEGLIDACDADNTLYARMGEEVAWQLGRWGKPSEASEDPDDGKKKD